MAFLQFTLTWNTFALVANTAATAGAVKSAANQCVKILEAGASHDGATSTFAPDIADFARCTFATAGTPGSTPTALKLDVGRAETVQSVTTIQYSAEPTVVTPLKSLNIAQFNGLYHYITPQGAPIIVAPGGTATGFAVRLKSPNNVNTTGFIEAEE